MNWSGGFQLNDNSASVVNGPSDTISALEWSPDDKYIAVSSWSKEVAVYQIQPQNNSTVVANFGMKYDSQAPVLDVAWNGESNILFSGGGDCRVTMKDLQENKEQQVAQHDKSISGIFFCPGVNILITTSWDATVKFWDCRQQAPVLSLNTGERTFQADCRYPVLAIAKAEKRYALYNIPDLQKTTSPEIAGLSALKAQTNSIALFRKENGFIIGAVDGKCWVNCPKDSSKSFPFRACRQQQDQRHGCSEVYSVNCIDEHPTEPGVFMTGGSDGSVAFWNRNTKQKIRQVMLPQSITAAKFNTEGSVLAYAVGYDWMKGYENNPGDFGSKLYLYVLQPQDVKKTGYDFT